MIFFHTFIIFELGISNFIVGVSFLPLRNWLASIGTHHKPGEAPDDEIEEGKGRVFYVFAAILLCCGVTLSRLYRKAHR
jgi:hypothetical protein